MGFSASTRQLGDVTIVDVRGRFTLIEGEAVHELLEDLYTDGKTKIVLNLRDVTYLDSSGVGMLMRALYSARKNNAELRAVDLSSRVNEVLRLAQLHKVFADFPDEASALRDFGRADGGSRS